MLSASCSPVKQLNTPQNIITSGTNNNHTKVPIINPDGPGVPESAAVAVRSQTPPGKISPMRQGNFAPYDGVLFSSEAVAWTIAQIDLQSQRIKLERENATAVSEAICKKRLDDINTRSRADSATKQAQIESLQQQLETHRKQIENFEIKGTGPDPLIWAGLGGLGGILVTLGIIAAVNSTIK